MCWNEQLFKDNIYAVVFCCNGWRNLLVDVWRAGGSNGTVALDLGLDFASAELFHSLPDI